MLYVYSLCHKNLSDKISKANHVNIPLLPVSTVLNFKKEFNKMSNLLTLNQSFHNCFVMAEIVESFKKSVFAVSLLTPRRQLEHIWP